MSEIHKFLFEGLPVRGVLVRLTGAWTEVLQRRESKGPGSAYPEPVRDMLGEMLAAATLMQSNIKFNGSLIMQIFGDGPVKLAVAEVQPDFGVRAMATVIGEVPPGAVLSQMVNVGNDGKCAITLDPKTRFPGQQPYQGVVPLFDDHGQPIDKISEVLEHYMLQSEQLDTRLVLAANGEVAAGLLIQRLPVQGEGNLAGSLVSEANEDEIGVNEHFNRIAILASTLKREELLTLDVDTLLRRLFWEESLVRFDPLVGDAAPKFSCTCSRERVSRMLESLGQAEVESVLEERGEVEVVCEFCGAHYRFDAVDAGALFKGPVGQVPGSDQVQ